MLSESSPPRERFCREIDANNMMSINTTSPSVIDVQESLFMDIFLSVGYLICALFGIVLNVTIIIFILARRRLRRQPRNTIWIGIGFSNIFVSFTNLLEPIEYYSPAARALCGIHLFLIGFPGAAFLMFNFLSLVDRYLSIFHSVWYRRCVTVRLVLGIQLAAFVILFFLMKSHYIFGLIQVKCNVVHSLDRRIYFGFVCFLFILCLSSQLTLYIMVKKHLVLPRTCQEDGTNGACNTTTDTKASSPASAIQIVQPGDSSMTRHCCVSTDNNEEIITAEKAVEALGQRVESSNNVIKKDLHLVRIRYQIVSRFELEATRNLSFSVGILLLFCLPWIVASVSAMSCNVSVINQTTREEEEAVEETITLRCSRHYWAISYAKFLSLIGHCIYQFLCYVSRIKEFCAGLGHNRHSEGINNRCSRARNPTGKFKYQHRQRMREMHIRHGYNRQPGPLLRSEYLRRENKNLTSIFGHKTY